MKLAAWRKQHGWTQEKLAVELGWSQSYVRQMERAIDPLIPGAPIMIQIYVLSAGQVPPNEFYDLPDLRLSKVAA